MLLAPRLPAQVSTRWAVFGPERDIRGRAEETARLSAGDQLSVYQAVLHAFGARTGERRPWIAPRLLSDESGYARFDSMPTSMLRRLLASGAFRGACLDADQAPCLETGGVYTFSRIYQIASGAVRVFVSYRANPLRSDSLYLFMRGFAAEEVFRVERRAGEWIVTDHATVMIT